MLNAAALLGSPQDSWPCPGTGQFNLAQARRRERAVQGRKDEEGERRRREFHACKREIAARRARLNCYHVPVSGTLAHQFSSYANPFGVLESSNEDDEDDEDEVTSISRG